MTDRLGTALLAALLTLPLSGLAQDREAPVADVLNIDATVSSEIVPDLAVITLAIVREGTDVASLTRDINEALGKAFAEAGKTRDVIAANGGFSTVPRYDRPVASGGSGPRTGWQVRAEIVLKSQNFDALGTLVGKLTQTPQGLQIARSGFEISPELKTREGAALLDRGARAFQDKASAAARAFGYSGYAIRQVTIGEPQSNGGFMPKSYAAVAFDRSAAPLPLESGQVTLTLSVNGSLQLRK
jgi:predicted secreted protein